MASGGARARSGPAPDPNALRRERDSGEWKELPAAGREGAVPDWPLDGQSHREADLWAKEWARPQAIMWELDGQQLMVALFVRAFVAAENVKATAAERTLVRQLSDSLGISEPGMRSLRWKIVREESAAPRTRAPGRGSARDRFKVVDGGQGT